MKTIIMLIISTSAMTESINTVPYDQYMIDKCWFYSKPIEMVGDFLMCQHKKTGAISWRKL